ncbi:tripartite tricarboxylate transporter permease [Halalkalibacter nanhaiisediminis]|uniref:Putative tricarboxylic transport membrane protein n=1 Tax=Halalkalibacter nanhaiisediminis TaxID=688079 RepID=A0A562QN31_9BACI|nr:tripartite tricarboxylate transporter permease [Halalkalibacter nanhaiisediminis]TWI58137.1 putative tricarboxylic transport membrane protein [Halalkalibacter nanhaiisediminis]
MENLQNLFIPFTDPYLIFIIAVGTIAGIIIGAIPGLSVTMAVVLLVSLTFSWDLFPALALMMGVFVGGVYGGSRSAILLNIPGGPAALATTFDGYPLTQQGKAGYAIGITTIFSFIGGLIGLIFLIIAAPLVSDIAISFSPRDYFLLAVIGLFLVGSLSEGSLSKAIFAAGFGVIVGLVGMDPMNGAGRFTFDSLALMSGINFITALLGLFGFSEVLHQLKTLHDKGETTKVIGKIIPPFRILFNLLPLSIRVSVLGVLTGALPGVGGEIAALLAYDHAKRTVKKPKKEFGKGAYEGVMAPEAANNAAVGGALIPMLTLGIPGDAVTAVIIGGLFIHGLRPGPMLMTESPDLFYIIAGSALLANIFLLLFGLLAVSYFARIFLISKKILLPIVALITIIGAYAINNSITDVYWMLGFGVLGYFMKQYGFPVGPLVLGIILGPMIDVSFRRAVMSENGDLVAFGMSFFSSPISTILLLTFVFVLFSQTIWYKSLKAKVFGRKSE